MKLIGKYISFVDSDDRIAEDMIESLYDRIVGVKADMSVCQRFLIGESGDCLLYTSPSPRD